MREIILTYGCERIQILPPMRGTCPICAAMHEAELPHNRNSLYYRMKFRQQHGRFPTWEDAMAHCSEEMKAAWRDDLSRLGLMEGGRTDGDGGEERVMDQR